MDINYHRGAWQKINLTLVAAAHSQPAPARASCLFGVSVNLSLSPLPLAPSPWLTDVLTSLPSWRQRLCSLTLSLFERPSCPYLPIPSNFFEKAPCSPVCPHPAAGDILSPVPTESALSKATPSPVPVTFPNSQPRARSCPHLLLPADPLLPHLGSPFPLQPLLFLTTPNTCLSHCMALTLAPLS